MPEMELHDDAMLPVSVLAYMTWPNDARARATIEGTALANVVGTVARARPSSIPKALLLTLLDMVANALPLEMQSAEAGRRALGGTTAGNVLLTLIELHAEEVEPSFGKAERLVADYLSRATTGAGEHVAHSINTVVAARKSYWSVAHLWGAQCLYVDKLGHEGTIERLSTDDGFRAFLAAAQTLCKVGGLIQMADGTPALDPAETWTLPDSLRLPHFHATVNGLQDWQRDVLRDYVPRKRF